MCEANKICTCRGSTKPLRLEVGKTYVSKDGSKYKIVSDEYVKYTPESANYVGINLNKPGFQTFRKDGTLYSGRSNDLDLVKEYREPRITKMDIVLVKQIEKFWQIPDPNIRETRLVPVGAHCNTPYWEEISRKTVEFVED